MYVDSTKPEDREVQLLSETARDPVLPREVIKAISSTSLSLIEIISPHHL